MGVTAAEEPDMGMVLRGKTLEPAMLAGPTCLDTAIFLAPAFAPPLLAGKGWEGVNTGKFAAKCLTPPQPSPASRGGSKARKDLLAGLRHRTLGGDADLDF